MRWKNPDKPRIEIEIGTWKHHQRVRCLQCDTKFTEREACMRLTVLHFSRYVCLKCAIRFGENIVKAVKIYETTVGEVSDECLRPTRSNAATKALDRIRRKTTAR